MGLNLLGVFASILLVTAPAAYARLIPFDIPAPALYVEYVHFASGWKDTALQLKKVVIIGIRELRRDIMDDTAYLSCEIDFEAVDLERGESVRIGPEGVPEEIQYNGQMIDVANFITGAVAVDGCYFTPIFNGQ